MSQFTVGNVWQCFTEQGRDCWRYLGAGGWGAAANYYRWGNGLCICSRGEGNSEAAARRPAIDEVLKNEICLYLYFCATIHL